MTANKSTPKARSVFARNIREARVAIGLSQEELAEISGLHRTYVGSVERGERNISIDNMERLAAALNKSLLELLDDKQPTPGHKSIGSSGSVVKTVSGDTKSLF